MMKQNNYKLSDPGPLILFDGYCNLCSASVKFILRHEKHEYYYFASLQSEFVRLKYPNFFTDESDPASVILIDKGNVWFASDAAVRICRRLKFPFSMLYYFRFIPRFLRDGVYNFIARKRYRYFGRTQTCFIPEKDYRHRFPGD